jgi:hypothetical protein
MSKVPDSDPWPISLDATHDIIEVRMADGRTIAAGAQTDRTEAVLHLHEADDSAIGACVEVDRWRGDDDHREFEIEVIPLHAVASIVWRDPKRR